LLANISNLTKDELQKRGLSFDSLLLEAEVMEKEIVRQSHSIKNRIEKNLVL